MRPHDAVAALRPRPCGPPLRGRAPLRDGITDTRPTGLDDMAYRAAGSTLKSPIRGRRLGVGAFSRNLPFLNDIGGLDVVALVSSAFR